MQVLLKDAAGSVGTFHSLPDEHVAILQTFLDKVSNLAAKINSISTNETFGLADVNTRPVVGMIVPICSTKTEISYSYCISGDTYTAIFRLCNGDYDVLDDSEYFNLGGDLSIPNLEGKFLRGYGSQTITQNGVTTTYTSGALGVGGKGEYQGDASRQLYGTLPVGGVVGTGDLYNKALTGVFSYDTSVTQAGFATALSKTAVQTYFNSSRVVPTDVENRPVNVAVNYYICVSSGHDD